MSGPGLFSFSPFPFWVWLLCCPLFPRLESSTHQVRGLKLAPTGQGGSSKVVEQDPCPVDDDKLLTTNQPTAFIMLVPELNTTHTKPSTCFSSSPPLSSPPYVRPWPRITQTYRAGQGSRA